MGDFLIPHHPGIPVNFPQSTMFIHGEFINTPHHRLHDQPFWKIWLTYSIWATHFHHCKHVMFKMVQFYIALIRNQQLQ